MEVTEGRVTKLEDRSKEIIQLKKEGKKIGNKMKRDSETWDNTEMSEKLQVSGSF